MAKRKITPTAVMTAAPQTQVPYRSTYRSDPLYDNFVRSMSNNLQAIREPLFTVATEGLWDMYINAFTDPVERQHHNCNACRRFLNKFGGLVTVDPQGNKSHAFFCVEDAPVEYREAIRRVVEAVISRPIQTVFHCSDRVWIGGSGLDTKRQVTWTHFGLTPRPDQVYRHAVLSAYQAMAESREKNNLVFNAMHDYSIADLKTALNLVQADALYRGNVVFAQAQWLLQVREAVENKPAARASAYLWRETGLAPAGMCHPKSSMLGTLLEDIQAGLSTTEITERFKQKMNPMQYQRPQAAPGIGNLRQAEKLVEQLNIQNSLKRRFAMPQEIRTIWSRPYVRQQGGLTPSPTTGVFAHIQPRQRTQRATPPADTGPSIPPVTMTWVKFRDTVLPRALAIEYFTIDQPEAYVTFVTAEDMSAPPILQWDTPAQRNPVSFYFWNGGRRPEVFNLPPASYVPVTGVAYLPRYWHSAPPSGPGDDCRVCFLLEGAWHVPVAGAGLALFPEFLAAELRGIRASIEAFSKAGALTLPPNDNEMAAGIAFPAKEQMRLRVTTETGKLLYILDRWD